MLRKIIKRLNDFRLSSIIGLSISGVAALYSLLAFIFYALAGQKEGIVGFYYQEGGKYLGMFVFFTALISLIISIYAAYSFVPFIKNKEKLTSKKGLFLAGFISGVLQIALTVLMILLITSEEAKTKVGIIIILPFGILAIIGQLLYLFVYLKCNFYMPEVKHN